MLLIRKRGEPESAWHAPEVTMYENEQALQTLIQQSPTLLPGVHEAMVIVAEMAVAAGYIDLVGVETDSSITIVECKLNANPEIRRQVIGQVFAYAASLSGMTYEAFDEAFAHCAGKSLAQSVADLSPSDWDEEVFRHQVTGNLAQGQFRLVIAVDQITEELKSTVRYLNQHTIQEVQVLALELGYIADEGVEILDPATYGEESAQARAGGSGSRVPWNEETLYADLANCCTPKGVEAARDLLEFLKSRTARLQWGRGMTASVNAWIPVEARPVSTVSIGTWAPSKGGVWAVNFDNLQRAEVPHDALIRLANKLRGLPGVAEEKEYVGLERAGFKKNPSLSIDATLAQVGALDTVKSALNELMAIRRD